MLNNPIIMGKKMPAGSICDVFKAAPNLGMGIPSEDVNPSYEYISGTGATLSLEPITFTATFQDRFLTQWGTHYQFALSPSNIIAVGFLSFNVNAGVNGFPSEAGNYLVSQLLIFAPFTSHAMAVGTLTYLNHGNYCCGYIEIENLASNTIATYSYTDKSFKLAWKVSHYRFYVGSSQHMVVWNVGNGLTSPIN